MSYTTDQDVVLIGAVSHAPAIVHLYEGLTFAAWAGALADDVIDRFFLYLNAQSSQNWLPLWNLNFEFPKGSTIFYAPEFSATLGQLFFATSADTASFETRLG